MTNPKTPEIRQWTTRSLVGQGRGWAGTVTMGGVAGSAEGTSREIKKLLINVGQAVEIRV
jgi:hypothetical protein